MLSIISIMTDKDSNNTAWLLHMTSQNINSIVYHTINAAVKLKWLFSEEHMLIL